MEDSILINIKKLLGLPSEYEQFDEDIIMHINTVLGILFQMGVGTSAFFIRDESAVWSDFIGDEVELEMVKSYIYAKVKTMFDPPTSGSVSTSLENMIKELEWRIYIHVNSGGCNHE